MERNCSDYLQKYYTINVIAAKKNKKQKKTCIDNRQGINGRLDFIRKPSLKGNITITLYQLHMPVSRLTCCSHLGCCFSILRIS